MEYLTRQYPRSPSQCCLVTSWGQNPGSMSWLPPNIETGGEGVGSIIPATEGIISAKLETIRRVGYLWASGRLAHVEKAIGDLSWRAKALYKARWVLWEEGGWRGRRP